MIYRPYYYPIYLQFVYISQQLNRMQILKDYHLCEDLTRLNHDEYFYAHFKTPELVECICGPTNGAEYLEQYRNLYIYFLNLSHTEDKSVYILLKWLLTAHGIVKSVKYGRVIRDMEEALGKISQAKLGGRYQHYLFERLVKPYKHYLQKLCMLLQTKTIGDGIKTDRNKRNQKQRANQEWFMKYNLVKYALYQFCPVLAQFIPFFKQNYPFLGQLGEKVGMDIQRFITELKNGYKCQEYKFVEKHELDSFEEEYGKLLQFLPARSVETLIFTQSQFCSGKVQNFFESASKVQGSILFA